MSASPLCSWAFHTPSVAEKQAFKLGYELGLAPESQNKDDLFKLLYEAPPVKLMQITEKLGSVNGDFFIKLYSFSLNIFSFTNYNFYHLSSLILRSRPL